jgi:hypothetical protein
LAVDFNRDKNPLLEMPKGKIKLSIAKGYFSPRQNRRRVVKVSWDIAKHGDKAGLVG